MAEMAVAAFGALQAAGSATMAMMPAASTVSSILGGVATAGSVLMGVQRSRQSRLAGDAALMQGHMDAEVAQLEGERAATQSAAKAAEIRRQAVRQVGAARVAFAGAGLDISSGQLAGVERDIEGEAKYGIEFENSNADVGRSEAALNAARYRARGQNAAFAARQRSTAEMVDAGVTGARGLLSLFRRG